MTAATFTAYPGSSGDTDFGAAIAPTGRGCLDLLAPVTQTDAAANTALANVTSVGLDFTVTDTRHEHSQSYSALASVPTLGSA